MAGGLLPASLGWRSIFLVKLPPCALGRWRTARHVPACAPGPAGRGLDPLGQALAILALTASTAAVIEWRPPSGGP